MKRYRIFSEPNGGYNGCIPITVHWVQVLKETFWGVKWENVKGFDTYDAAKKLLIALS